MATCEECGSRQVLEVEIDGVLLERCPLCDHVQGDEAGVAHVQDRIEAEELGYDPAIFPLVKSLDSVPTFRVTSASPGHPGRGEYPYVFLRVAEGLSDVEHLLTSLEMANRSTKRRWVVELSLQRGLLFILRPRFWKAILDITADDILEARADLALLALTIGRDVRLSWWRGS